MSISDESIKFCDYYGDGIGRYRFKVDEYHGGEIARTSPTHYRSCMYCGYCQRETSYQNADRLEELKKPQSKLDCDYCHPKTTVTIKCGNLSIIVSEEEAEAFKALISKRNG
jgi:hypothetical protein